MLVFAFIKHTNSTASVRVIIPAPAAAGGLNRDYADERSSQFETTISALRQRFAAGAHGGAFGAALYLNAPADSSARDASVVLLYLGVNSPVSGDPAAGIKTGLSGLTRMNS